jgi:hypothetical protein
MGKRKKMPKEIVIDRSSEGTYDWTSPVLRRVIENMAAAGMTDNKIANLLGVQLGTLKRRLKSVPALEEKLVAGRSEATQIAAATLYETAIGGRVITKIKEKIDSKGKVFTDITTEELEPNPQLLMFWLCNQDPQNWKNHRDLEKQEQNREVESDAILESDKIARLSRGLFAGHTDGTESECAVPTETAQSTFSGPVDAGDLPADVSGQTADNLQDNVLDVSAEEGAEPDQASAVHYLARSRHGHRTPD